MYAWQDINMRNLYCLEGLLTAVNIPSKTLLSLIFGQLILVPTVFIPKKNRIEKLDY